MNRRRQYAVTTAALVAAVVFATPVSAQRARESLSERVAQLEQQLQNQGDAGASNTLTDLVLRLAQLEAEIRELRGLVEEQGFEVENLRSAQRDQYLDLDRRLSEGRALPSSDSFRAGQNLPSAFPLDPTAPSLGGLPAEDRARGPFEANETPDVRAPIEAGLQTTGLGDNRPRPVAAVVDPVAEKSAYDQAFDALKNGRYAEAARLFAVFVEQYPTGEYSDNAQYWLAESYYVTGNYRIALDAFQALLNRFPQSGKAPDAKLKLGYTYFSLKEWRAAEEVLKQVVTEYPNTTVSRLAENRLRAMRLEGHIQ